MQSLFRYMDFNLEHNFMGIRFFLAGLHFKVDGITKRLD